MTNDTEDLYPCIGICTPDPDSGYCQGCGRPPLPAPASTNAPAKSTLEETTQGRSPVDTNTQHPQTPV